MIFLDASVRVEMQLTEFVNFKFLELYRFNHKSA